MGSPTITIEPALPLAERLEQFVPVQGNVEYQRDGANRTHHWHKHSVNEILYVLRGELEVFWLDEGTVRRQNCGAETKIVLPAETVHGSTAGAGGCTYLIAPENVAVTTFLPIEEYPPE
jgi:quercetin dioxygenase-like cupin family protein